MFCRSCGASVNKDDSFCAACGTAVALASPTTETAPTPLVIEGKPEPSGTTKFVAGCVGIFLVICVGLWIVGTLSGDDKSSGSSGDIQIGGTITIVGYGNSVVAGSSCSGTGDFKSLKPGGYLTLKGDGEWLGTISIRSGVYTSPGVCQMVFLVSTSKADMYEFAPKGLPSISKSRSSMSLKEGKLLAELVWGS